MLRVKTYLLSLLFFAASTVSAQDDISVREGAFEVFYSALNTSFLKPDVAAAAGIVRAKNRGMINISVIEHLPENSETATKPAELVSVKVVLYDLIHTRNIELKEINEPNARYYIGDFKISNDHEKMIFRISVLPKGGKQIDFEFQRHLYID